MAQAILDPAVVEGFGGELLRDGDPGYDDARRVFNAAIDRRPAIIARCTGVADVIDALALAREHGLEVSVRGGGHSVAGHAVVEDGLMIDLRPMNRVRVDPERRTAWCGGGANWGELDRETQAFGLAVTGGRLADTGVGGLTLGGGIGWVMRRYGLAIDSLRSAEVVTAEGEVVRASEEENPDLFWALRGGGGNFGVVTEFELDLHPFGPEVLGGMVLHRLEDAPEALRFCRDFMETAPDALAVFETFMTVPPEAPFPAELQGAPALALGIVYAGPVDEGERVLRPLRAFGRPALDLVAPMPVLAIQQMLDPTSPHGMRSYSRSHWLGELPDAAIDEQVRHHAEVPSPMSLIINGRMGGAIERVPREATAFGHRDANRLLLVVSAWWEGDDAEQIEWCKGAFDAMTPYSSGGVYVNFVEEEGDERVRAGYADDVWLRLVAAKKRWDPDNVFHLNANIPPS
jgi:FAD/FMN-containing dehydrogenase